MSVPLCPGSEPIAGYRLTRFLGRGGFGEVWAAEAPGGLGVALKFVVLDSGQVEPELNALRLLRSLRHPNLLDYQFACEADGWLVIGMPLCERSLQDRLRECLDQRLDGIPVGELLEYMTDAARALDFLNEARHDLGEGRLAGVQHRDVKPQNILLSGGAVRVADFGLAKALAATAASHSGGMTPLYAPPELFEGRVAGTSDQYSLAVTYYHLRSGRLPFSGSYIEVAHAHRKRAPDLGTFQGPEKEALARALSKAPPDRWPNCREFVRHLSAPSPVVAAPPTRLPDSGKESAREDRPRAELPLIDSRDLARREQLRWTQQLNVEPAWTSDLGVRFRLIPAGRFLLGAGPGDPGARPNEQPRCPTRIDRPFWAATFVLTNGLVRQFLQAEIPEDLSQAARLFRDRSFARHCRAGEGADDAPAVEISAEDVEILCAWMGRLDGRGYRLPTEAEWEYLARAGASGAFWWEEHVPAERLAIFAGRSPAPLDERRANAWGIVDALGNVREWTASPYALLEAGVATRPAGPLDGKARVVRGGSWRDLLGNLRLSWRESMFAGTRADNLGARIVCDLDGPETRAGESVDSERER